MDTVAVDEALAAEEVLVASAVAVEDVDSSTGDGAGVWMMGVSEAVDVVDVVGAAASVVSGTGVSEGGAGGGVEDDEDCTAESSTDVVVSMATGEGEGEDEGEDDDDEDEDEGVTVGVDSVIEGAECVGVTVI